MKTPKTYLYHLLEFLAAKVDRRTVKSVDFDVGSFAAD